MVNQNAARNWEMLDADPELVERELASFVPERIFDSHAHLYSRAHFRSTPPAAVACGPELADLACFQREMAAMLPGRHVSGLFFGWPSTVVDLEANNALVAAEARRDPNSRSQMLIVPEMDPEWIRSEVRRSGFAGLKCYHVFAREKPTFEAAIPSYLPEEHVRIAHEEGLSITLHMVRARAMADPLNQQVLRAWAEKYPNARFILAHAARGFNPHHTVEGIGSLRGLHNIWCDTSAVTDCGAYEAIVRTFGVDRLLYGADFPVSHQRGRCVAVGDSFLWLSAENVDFRADYASICPSLVGLESLRVLKLAC